MQREIDARREEVARPEAAEVKRAFACRRCGYGIVALISRLPRCPMCGSRTAWRELRRPLLRALGASWKRGMRDVSVHGSSLPLAPARSRWRERSSLSGRCATCSAPPAKVEQECRPRGGHVHPMGGVVIAAVGGRALRATARPADLAAHGRHTVEQRDQLGDVVAVAARNRPGKRDPGRVDQEVVLGAVSGSINRARARRGAPFFACT
jgi:hypothetical protein